MKISANFDVRRNALLEEIKDLQQQKATALQELHKIQHEIADQRSGKNEVYKEKVKLETEVYWLENTINILKQLAKKEQADFYKMTSNQRETIIKLASELTEKAKERQEYQSKEVIDIDAVNVLYKQQMQKLNDELQAKRDEVLELSKQRIEFEKWVEDETEKVEVVKKKIENDKIAIANTKKEQDIRERRLTKRKEELRPYLHLIKKDG